MRVKALALLAAAIAATIGAEASAFAAGLEVQGTEFVLRPDRGPALRGDGLVGTLFTLRTAQGDQPIRIDGLGRQPTAWGPVMLYRFSVQDPASGAWQPLCAPDVRGRQAGFPIPDEGGGFSLTCTSGAEGKCILLGYRPWEETPGGLPMRDLFRACIHMIRADYGGDGRPATRDGTMIDVYDHFGIQSPSHFSSPAVTSPPAPSAPAAPKADGSASDEMSFEAAWSTDGAVCVAHPRYADLASLAQIESRYPHLRGRLGPEACSEERMRAQPRAILFNLSR